ncbi:unnamed protein product [Peniophora sp. CBMAI 1063]|nr:unnamed protein product [Peniophora sp. CBMAI 1063]
MWQERIGGPTSSPLKFISFTSISTQYGTYTGGIPLFILPFILEPLNQGNKSKQYMALLTYPTFFLVPVCRESVLGRCDSSLYRSKKGLPIVKSSPIPLDHVLTISSL